MLYSHNIPIIFFVNIIQRKLQKRSVSPYDCSDDDDIHCRIELRFVLGVTCHFTANGYCETFPVCCEKFPVCCETFPIYNQTFSVHDNGQDKVKGWVRSISLLGLGSKVVKNIIKEWKKVLLF